MSIDSDSIVTHASVDNDEPLTGVQFSKTMKFMPSLFRSKKKDDSFTRLSSKGRELSHGGRFYKNRFSHRVLYFLV